MSTPKYQTPKYEKTSVGVDLIMAVSKDDYVYAREVMAECSTDFLFTFADVQEAVARVTRDMGTRDLVELADGIERAARLAREVATAR